MPAVHGYTHYFVCLFPSLSLSFFILLFFSMYASSVFEYVQMYIPELNNTLATATDYGINIQILYIPFNI